jgi:hypothetical protein
LTWVRMAEILLKFILTLLSKSIFLYFFKSQLTLIIFRLRFL